MVQPFDIEKMFVHSGRVAGENNGYVNLADIMRRFNRTLNPLNSIQTAEPYPVVSLKSNYGKSYLRDEEILTGTATVSNTVGDGVYLLETGTTAGSKAILDSVERGRYVSGTVAVPGLGVRVPTDLTGDQSARWGYFSDDDGFGFGCDANGLFVFRRYSGVETKVYRASWDDPLDGTGPSGATLDKNGVDIYQLPFRWYGSGPISFQVSGSGTRTDTLLVHVIEAPNNEPIVADPNLQIRAEVDNGTSTENAQLEVYGRQFSILGRYNPNRRVTSDFRLDQAVGTTFVPLVSFRQKTAYRSVSVKTSGIDLLAANADLIFQIRVGATLTGASFVNPNNIPSDETALEFDTSATALTNGQAIYTGVADAGTGINSVGSGRDIPEVDLPVNQNITLCARSISGNATVTSVFRAREEW